MRGPEDLGYPFLNDVPEQITVMSVAVPKKPATSTNPITGKRHYCAPNDKVDMLSYSRLTLYAVIESGCTAVVLSALGCGLGGHPPEQVATMFKREIYRVGNKMPYIYFAIKEDSKQVEVPSDLNANWRSAKQVFNNEVLNQANVDFPEEEELGDAGGPGTKLLLEPTGEEGKRSQPSSSDVPMGTSTTEAAC